MIAALFDTNIVIDLLDRRPEATFLIDAADRPAISALTWMEVMVGIRPQFDAVVRVILADFELIAIDQAIMERAVVLRRDSRIKLVDAIIWATAQTRDLTFVTRNTKDFPDGTPGVLVPYAV